MTDPRPTPWAIHATDARGSYPVAYRPNLQWAKNYADKVRKGCKVRLFNLDTGEEHVRDPFGPWRVVRLAEQPELSLGERQ